MSAVALQYSSAPFACCTLIAVRENFWWTIKNPFFSGGGGGGGGGGIIKFLNKKMFFVC